MQQDRASRACDVAATVRGLRWIAGLLVAIPAFLTCCVLHRTASVPVRTLLYAKRPEGSARTLVIFLPGKRSRIGDFDRKRFIGMARERGVDADLMEADLHLEYYRDGTFSRRLWEDVVAPARASGYQRIWIVGISLGGLGALAFAREHPDTLAGLVLLSPYLGPPGLTEQIPVRSPALYLGYGRNERMAPSLDLLAESLPAGHVARVPGGHRWPTWQALWAEFLSRHLFDEPNATNSSTEFAA